MYYTDTKRWFGNKASEENHDFAHCVPQIGESLRFNAME